MSQPFRSAEEIIHSYQKNIDAHLSAIRQLKQTRKILSITRLAVVVLAIGMVWYLPLSLATGVAVVFSSILFVFMVFRDADKSSAIKNFERLIEINQREINAMLQNMTSYEDGHIYSDTGHAYASDLDLFGPFSLFQWLSRCHADQSGKLLSEYLKHPTDTSVISEKQKAAKELSEMQAACQQFQSVAMANPLTLKTENRVKYWMGLSSGPFEKPYWKWILTIYSLMTISLLILFILDYIPNGHFLFCCIAFLAFSFSLSRKINPVFEMLSSIQPEMDSLHEQLRLIEKENFSSDLLLQLQNRLKPSGYASSSAAFRSFHIILKRFEYRLNLVVFLFLNSFLLWDLRQVIALNDWKKKNQFQLTESFGIIAEMEVCISLASLVHNEPAWCFPEVDNHYFHFEGQEIGHPLIHAKERISNDFSLEGIGRIAVITGSNMAGKSTFLRSLGINTVLALMGAPVCAKQMRLSNVKLISSMRVADNLAENTSTFYAELKKLQYIIQCVNQREQTFILLDEVLRGTNSTDRHKGSRALIRQMLQEKAVAVIATHDTELAHAEAQANKAVSNYYFEGTITGHELFFDYKIKKGICESLNATTLMKKIGIHFED